MENYLFKSLNFSAGAIVLNIKYRIGHVAIYIAKKGLYIIGINIINYHIIKVRRNIKTVNYKQQISI